MGRKVDLDLLVGAEGLVERLGLKRVERVHELRRRNADFPEPVLRFKRVMVWYWPDVERWARRHGRIDPKGRKAT